MEKSCKPADQDEEGSLTHYSLELDNSLRTEYSLELGFLQAIVNISDRRDDDSPAHVQKPDLVRVTLESLAGTCLGTLEELPATNTVSDMKASIATFLLPSGKAPGVLLYNYCPLDMERTLSEVFCGEHEVTVQTNLLASSPAPDESLERADSSQSKSSSSQERGGNDQLWEIVQNGAIEQIHVGNDRRDDLPYAHSMLVNKCLGPRGYVLPGYGVEVVGSGSFGRVFKVARKGESSPLFAVKRQPLGKFDESSVPIFRETSILHALRGHPNIVKVVDAFLAVIKPEVPEIWAVLEYYEGDLESVFSQRADFTSFYEGDILKEAMAKAVVFQILLGINALHRKDIVHRDLKPKNILLNLEPQLKVALCDFGMSRSVHGLLTNVKEDGVRRRQSQQSQEATPSPLSCPPELTSASRESSDGGQRKGSTPQPPSLKREFSVHIMTASYRAPEMFGFADVSIMQKPHFKSLDIYSLGLVWAKLLVGTDVLRHDDDLHPSEFLLLENLKKVDCPTLDDISNAGYRAEAVCFIKLALDGDMDAIRERWNALSWPLDVQLYENKQRREVTLEAGSRTIDAWINDNRGKAVSPDATQLIADATRFCYTKRISTKDMLMHSYFDAERSQNLEFDRSKDHVEDVKVAMGSHLSRISTMIERKKKCPKLSVGQPPALKRTLSEEKTSVDIQAICALLREELENLQTQTQASE